MAQKIHAEAESSRSELYAKIELLETSLTEKSRDHEELSTKLNENFKQIADFTAENTKLKRDSIIK